MDHRWLIAAFALGLFVGWFTTWVTVRTLVTHYRSEVLYWRKMWRTTDKILTRHILQQVQETEAYDGEVRELFDEEAKEEPLPEPVNRATTIERLIRDRDALDQDPSEDRN